MEIAIFPAMTTIASDTHVTFRVHVKGERNTAVTVWLTGNVGTPLPQTQPVVLDDAGHSAVAFRATFHVTSDTVTGIVCGIGDGTAGAPVVAVSTVTVIAPGAHP